MSRFKIEKGSASGHCCFDYSIIDTKEEDRNDSIVCETWHEEWAEKILTLLNKGT